jgi:23S rRNA (uracil1939-C5)-methyltransferase
MYFNLMFQAPCKHYGLCGGCSLQHIEEHGKYKFSQLKNDLSKLNIEFILHPLQQISIKSRRRANFKVDNKLLSLNKASSHQKIAISNCLLLEDQLNKLIPPINKLLSKLTSKIVEINIQNSDTGVELLFISQKISNLIDEQLLSSFAIENKIARIAWKYKDQSPYTIIQLNPIQMKFDNVNIDLPIGSFLQVSKESINLIGKAITDNLDSGKQTLELYCGCGSFTIPILNKTNNIYAIEGSQDAITALKNAANNYALKIKTATKDLYQNPVQTSELDNYSQIVINPPRNGSGPQFKQIAKTVKVKKVIVVSCSVENFIRDSFSLLDGEFKLTEIYPIDQFLYSKHLEIIAVFLRSC